VDSETYFDNEPEARKFVSDYNNETEVPDWYKVAIYCG
jgi:hypothetical protein